jgi:hypothetical protein
MERYLWIFNRNQESYKFEFYIGEELNRFENEGIYQDIRLSINNESTFYSNFGRMESLDFLNIQQIGNMIVFQMIILINV